MKLVPWVIVIGTLASLSFGVVELRRGIDGAMRLYAAQHGNWSGAGASATAIQGERIAPRLVAQQGGGATDTISFGDAASLVLVFDSRCSVCNENMPRWLELIERIERERLKIRVYALSLDSTVDRASEYWSGLQHHVRVIIPQNRTDALAALHVASTPTSVAIRQGQVVSSYVGVLGRHRQQHLIDQLR